MLPALPTLIDPNDVRLKELKELTSIEQALFVDFLHHNNNNYVGVFPENLSISELLAKLKKVSQDDNLWVVYFRQHFVGFWYIEEVNKKMNIFVFLSPENHFLQVEKFCVGLFKNIAEKSSITIFLNIENFSETQKNRLNLLLTDNKESNLVDCKYLQSDFSNEDYNILLTQIKEYYA